MSYNQNVVDYLWSIGTRADSTLRNRFFLHHVTTRTVASVSFSSIAQDTTTYSALQDLTHPAIAFYLHISVQTERGGKA
jgi:hypothetical protein